MQTFLQTANFEFSVVELDMLCLFFDGINMDTKSTCVKSQSRPVYVDNKELDPIRDLTINTCSHSDINDTDKCYKFANVSFWDSIVSYKNVYKGEMRQSD